MFRRNFLTVFLLSWAVCFGPSVVDAQSSTTQSRFIFADLVSDRPIAARDFYRKLFGWKFSNREGVPTEQSIFNGGHEIGGLISIADADPQRVEGQWIPVLSVTDVDLAYSAARQNGGRVVLSPRDDRVAGRYAVVRDPGGALVTLFDGPAPTPQPRKTGNVVWYDLFTSGQAGASQFYKAVAGLQTSSGPDFAGRTTRLLTNGAAPVGGVVTIPRGEVRPTWLPYFGVTDLNGMRDKALGLGARLVGQAEGAVIMLDPTGIGFGIHDLDGEG